MLCLPYILSLWSLMAKSFQSVWAGTSYARRASTTGRLAIALHDAMVSELAVMVSPSTYLHTSLTSKPLDLEPIQQHITVTPLDSKRRQVIKWQFIIWRFSEWPTELHPDMNLESHLVGKGGGWLLVVASGLVLGKRHEINKPICAGVESFQTAGWSLNDID